MSLLQVQNEINYCNGDFCSKGFPVKKARYDLGFKTDPLGNTLTGCPLEEKISEMQLLKRDGNTIAALAMVMLDNPMCPVTGHRICNDCMKIEPLPDQFLKHPIRNYSELKAELDNRITTGFGGVAEYGITVRWDKNFLSLIYLTLLRRPYFQVYGGVRFGGTITV